MNPDNNPGSTPAPVPMTRAKFRVETVTHSANGAEVQLVPVTGGSPENDSFYKWTPYGGIKLGLLSPATAAAFKPGASFYVDFTPAE